MFLLLKKVIILIEDEYFEEYYGVVLKVLVWVLIFDVIGIGGFFGGLILI